MRRVLAAALLVIGCQGGVGGMPGGRVDAGGTSDSDGGTVPLPETPQGLTATAVSATEIDLCWSPAAGSPYRVYRDGSLVATVTEPAYRDGGLAPGTTSLYVVTAGDSAESEPASATTHLADADGDVAAGAVSAVATIHSIGVEWSLGGDADHDAAASVAYRAAGSCAWRRALPLVRVDYNGKNTLAGSVLFLEPATAYEVLLYLTDPDGGARTAQVGVTTGAVPVRPTGGRTLHVAPGAGGGDGSAGSPFGGVAAAQAAALPGDVFLLHAGRYGGRIRFDVGGEAGNHIAWVAAGDGEAIFDGIEVAADHLRFEGLRVEEGLGYELTIGIKTAGAPEDVAVVRCTIVDNDYGIWLNQGGFGWYIADNVIVGTEVVTSGSFSGEGVELQHTAGHTVAHNRISLVADGVSYCDRDCDIFGNDIFDTSDDGIEPDDGWANVRIWGNRLHNTGHNGISFQPMNGAPWYVIRNQIISNSETPLKFRTTDRFVFLHNTIVEWSAMQVIRGDDTLKAISRNNLWISYTGGRIWNLEDAWPDWRSDLDYDGFDWGEHPAPFRQGVSDFADVGALTAALGIEEHGVRVTRQACFPALEVPGAPPASIPAQTLVPAAECEGLDRGEVLPNVNDGFLGAAPDLGAFEHGAEPPIFGPRPAE